MLKRPFCGMAVCFLSGILIAAYAKENGWCLWFSASALLVCGMCMVKYSKGDVHRMRFRICLCVLMLLQGCGQYARAQIKRDEYLPRLYDGARLTMQGAVTEKQYRNGQYIYQMTSCYFKSNQSEVMAQELIPCNQVLAYSDSDAVSIGEILVLNGTVKLWEGAVNEGNFDAEAFYSARGIDFRLMDVEITGRHGRISRWREALLRLKLGLRQTYSDLMSEDVCGVIVTMVLGDKTLLTTETKQLYQTAGLSHVMAISGLHISIIGMGLYRFLRSRGLGFVIAGIPAGMVVYLYAVMAGMGTSVCRSVGMFALLLLAQAIGRSYDSLNALGLLALVLLWRNPFLLWDAGFLFSFAAVIGVTWVGGCVSFEGTAHETIKKTLFGSGAVQLMTLPLVAWNYYEVPPYAMLVNLLILPLMGSVLGFGIAGGFAGLVSVKAGALLLFFCEKLLKCIQSVCIVCAGLPQNMIIAGRPELWRILCYYAMLLVLTFAAYRRTEKGVRKISSLRAFAAASVLLVLLFFPIRQDARVDILDVGQGAAVFLRTDSGHTVFVDGGSTNVSRVGTYRILPFLKYNGVKKIDFWMVSHTDEDHISGLREILEAKYPIGHLVFAKGIVQDTVYQELLTLAKENGTKLLYLTAGDVLHLDEAKIHVLHPAAQTIQTEKAAEKNGASLVFVYEEGEFSAIFTGDIGSEQEQALCAVLKAAYEEGKIADRSLELYQAAHHGSSNSNSQEWLALLKPQISVVSCAKKNNYGHPGAEAIRHMEEAGSEVFCTMEGGQVSLKHGKKGIQLIQYNVRQR